MSFRHCHFPGKLLTRDTRYRQWSFNYGIGIGGKKDSGGKWLKACCRKLLDEFEERTTMSCADLMYVNSKFTKGEVYLAFPSLLVHDNDDKDDKHDKDSLQVLQYISSH